MTAIIDGTNGVTTPNVLTSSSGVALTLQSGGTTAVTIDTSQNVGVGTTSPGKKLDVNGITRVTNTSADAQLNIESPSGYSNFAYWRETGIANRGVIGFANGSANMQIRTNGSYDLNTGTLSATVNQYGVGVGTAVPSSGVGIAFPATQSASSDANTLDDYEEGTFTPSIVPDSGSITSQTGSGKYTKVGNVVTVVLYVTLTNVGTASGGMFLTGLPFVSVRASSSGRSFVALVREDAQTGFFYSCNGVTGGTGGYFYTLTTNGPPPYTNNYSYCFSVSYLTT